MRRSRVCGTGRNSRRPAGSIVDLLVGQQRDRGMDRATLDKTQAMLASMFATKSRRSRGSSARTATLLRGRRPPTFPVDRSSTTTGCRTRWEGSHSPRGKFELKSYDRGTGRAIVGWTQVMDPEVARRLMAEAIRKMGERLGKKPPDAEDLESLIVEDAAEFVLDARTGWIERFSHTRTTKSGRVSQEDIITMQRIEKN
ncbi:MAG: hypothetical protein WKF75_03115 [Singulisphaera sp.]